MNPKNGHTIHLPHGTTAESAATIYRQAFTKAYDQYWTILEHEVQEACKRGRKDAVVYFMKNEPHVFYAIAYRAVRFYDDINIAFDVNGGGNGDVRMIIQVEPGEKLDYSLTNRAYFRKHLKMTDEQINRRMARVHHALFPDVMFSTSPEDPCDTPASSTTAVATPTPKANEASIATATPTPKVVVVDEAVDPAKTAAAAPTPTTLRQFVVSWIAVSLVLYALWMAMHSGGFITLD